MSNELMNHKACQHTYDLMRYGRDDSGFWVDCTQCGETLFISAYTEDEFYNIFGLEEDEDVNHKSRWDEKQDHELSDDGPF